MITKEAIEHVAQGAAITAANAALNETIDQSFVALPSNFTLHDLEHKGEFRVRPRGRMTTPSIVHFAAYAMTHRETNGAAVFVDADAMTATAVLNMGSPQQPGHADNLAVLKLKETAPYEALRSLQRQSAQGVVSQRVLAEFMEDWALQIKCLDADGTTLDVKRCIDAVRRITIESARSVESSEQSLSTQRSAMESVAATSKAAPLPAFIEFLCAPYAEFEPRVFAHRLSVRTGAADKPSLTLAVHLICGELHQQEMAEELAEKIKAETPEAVPVYLGGYVAWK